MSHPFLRLSPLFLCISLACGGSASTPEQGAASPDAGPESIDPVDFAGFAVAPPSGDFKSKSSLEDKLDSMLAREEIPSVLSGAFIQVTRSYLSGREAQSDLERSVFATLDTIAPETLDAFGRVVDGVDALPSDTVSRIYDERFALAGTSDVLTSETLSAAVSDELRQRVSLNLFDTADVNQCLDNERPGLRRTTSCSDIDGSIESSCNRICRVGSPGLVQRVRTNGFIPEVPKNDYAAHEVEKNCTVDGDGNFVCANTLLPECTGAIGTGGTCLVVPTARPGESVTFQGFNFFSVDAEVVLLRIGSSQPRALPAHVCGDVTTDASAPVDCNVNDLITFSLPDDLATGRYTVRVAVPGDEGDTFLTEARAQPLLDVLPPVDVAFELVGEELLCLEETSPENFGSDEVGLSIITTPISSDGTLGALERRDIRFDDVDTGERRALESLLFSGRVDGALAVSILGFEVDGEQAFRDQIEGFEEAYMAVLESLYGAIATSLGTSAGVLIGAGFGGAAVGAAVGVLITLAIVGVTAVWLPPDLIMEDTDGIDFRGFAQRVSLSFPNPTQQSTTSPGGVEIVVEPCEDTDDKDFRSCDSSAKSAGQYRERRQYNQPDEDSRYELTFRYQLAN